MTQLHSRVKSRWALAVRTELATVCGSLKIFKIIILFTPPNANAMQYYSQVVSCQVVWIGCKFTNYTNMACTDLVLVPRRCRLESTDIWIGVCGSLVQEQQQVRLLVVADYTVACLLCKLDRIRRSLLRRVILVMGPRSRVRLHSLTHNFIYYYLLLSVPSSATWYIPHDITDAPYLCKSSQNVISKKLEAKLKVCLTQYRNN